MLSTTQKQSSWPELSFAIPSEILEHIARELIQHGQVTRGFIGAWVNPLTPEIRLTRSIPEEVQGVIVRKVSPGDPAERAGIIAGDVITKFNDKVIGTYQELIWQTALAGPGNEIPVEIWRDGELRTLLVGLERFVLPSEIPKQP
jgi:serine protease Do